MRVKISSLFERKDTETIEEKVFNKEDLPLVHMQRERQNGIIQEEYDKCKDHVSKLKFIYSLLLTTQGNYLEYTNNEFLNKEHLNSLIQELETKGEIDDFTFFKFINSKIIKPLDSGHVYLKPIEKSVEVVNQNQDNLKSINFKKDILDKEKKEKVIELKEKNMLVKCYDKTIYIQIKSFSARHLEQDEKTFIQIEKYLKDNIVDNVIFDIRGNTGGTDEYFEKLNMFTNKDIDIVERFRDLLANENYNITHNVIPASTDAKEYNRYLLVDDKVFSAAETLAIICKSSKFATVIGEKTDGEGFGFNPFTLDIVDKNQEYVIDEGDKIYNLKGITMTFPIEAPINKQGEIDYENFYNTIPDIICKSDDALYVALKQIKERKTNTTRKQEENIKKSNKSNINAKEDIER